MMRSTLYSTHLPHPPALLMTYIIQSRAIIGRASMTDPGRGQIIGTSTLVNPIGHHTRNG
uniref:Uncharacterized protein n=1 Tax=Picea glauca TaxID=3330 RepID=A0A101LUV7_PICGL|nr:hypothetical protein ABT39_MTgene2418 [Picea glauca]QHR86770.1 hypothetical protein Q903MT_gene774 [Picea sitchensis]